MILSEENNSKEEESSSNNENEFQELDNEIEKVIRGETSFEEEKLENNCAEINNTLNTSKTPKSCIKKDMQENKNKEYKFNKDSNLFDNMNDNLNKKLLMSRLMNKEKNQFNIYNNNINYNFLNNNFSNINKLDQNNQFPDIKLKNRKNKQSQNNMKNSNILTINLNQNNNYMNYFYFQNCNNNNIKDLLSLYYNNISNDYINNFQNLNINDNFNIINNNNNSNNFWKTNNININNQLFSNSNANIYNNIFFSQFQGGRVNDSSINNMIINNQFFKPNNINLDINNNKNESNQYINIINQYNQNNFNVSGFNNNINMNLSQNFKSNNVYSYNNQNVNNQMNLNGQTNLIEHIENQLKYNQNLIDLIKNSNIDNINNINNSKNLNQQNSQNNSNAKNEKKSNSKKQAFCNQNKNMNISIKRKIFNPLPDSEKEKNIINLMDVFQCKDLRTTLMIKNIPNKYTISTFLEEINHYFKNCYDIFYLPIDYINKCNLGFAFINFVEPFHIILFYELYRGKKWKKFNSDKMCELLYAKFQGRKELISHFEKGKVLSFDSEDKKPLILPVPHSLPKINLPCYYLKLFLKLYPNVSYEISCNNNNKNGACSLSKFFSINGNFKMN